MSAFVNTPGALRRSAPPASRKAAESRTWLDWLAQALRVVTTRRYLTEMDDRMLKDIGVSRMDAVEEANRAPWDFSPRAQ